MRWPRSFGVLLPVTSLPHSTIVGDLSSRTAGWLAEILKTAGARFWQVLPLHPLGPGFSPYASPSSFAGNPLLVSVEELCSQGLLEPPELEALPNPSRHAQYELAFLREQLLRRAFSRFRENSWHAEEFFRFCQEEAPWLDDWALFRVAKEVFSQQPFWRWPEEIARRHPAAIHAFAATHREHIEQVKFEQFLFDIQWRAFRHKLSPIQVIGDLPFYVARDSADVWAHPELFNLDADLQPLTVAGVPPDYFAPEGQLWGNPTYRWPTHRETGFAWWKARWERALRLYDVVRLDHFRGFAAAWEVPAGEPTARHGQWVVSPGEALFHALGDNLPVIAEDLGHITEDVVALRERFGFCGMAVLQFAFNPHERSSFLPHRHHRNLVVYTGTHDNNTAVGWWEEEVTSEIRSFFRAYAGTDEPPHQALVRLAMASVADLVIIPVHDVLGLPSSCRINRPGTPSGNWTFRLLEGELDATHAAWLRRLAWVYDRLP